MRATGKTYRKCLNALLAASEGKRVCFMVGNIAEYKHIIWSLRSLSAGYSSTVRAPERIDFASGGYVLVALATREHQGSRYDMIVEDELLGLTDRKIGLYFEKIKSLLNDPR